MKRKHFIDKIWSKLEWQPLQVYLKHYRSAEIDLSAIAVAYYLLLTAFPLIVIAANIFPYLNIDVNILLAFMKKNLPTNLYPSVSAITIDIFSKPSVAAFRLCLSLTSSKSNAKHRCSATQRYCHWSISWCYWESLILSY